MCDMSYYSEMRFLFICIFPPFQASKEEEGVLEPLNTFLDLLLAYQVTGSGIN